VDEPHAGHTADLSELSELAIGWGSELLAARVTQLPQMVRPTVDGVVGGDAAGCPTRRDT
jgi:hypothetical protein